MKKFLFLGWIAGAAATHAVAQDYPQWWMDRNVINTNANVSVNDFAAVNQGQVKHMAEMAQEEFDRNFEGAGPAISNLVAGFANTNNYCPVNLGQLKNLATNFYGRLVELGETSCWPAGMAGGPYPWSGSTNSQDGALANIGQLKYLFSFVFDRDGDGLSDWWERKYGFDPAANNATGDPDLDGRSNLAEFQEKTDPLDTLDLRIGFEAGEGYSTGDVHGVNFWISTGAVVQTECVFTNQQALLLTGSDSQAQRPLVTEAANVVHEFYIHFDELGVAPSEAEIPAGATVLLGSDTDRGLLVYDSTGWVSVTNGAGFTNRWIEVRIEQDLTAKTWDLWVDGVELCTGVGFRGQAGGLNAICLQNNSSGIVGLDNLSIQKMN